MARRGTVEVCAVSIAFERPRLHASLCYRALMTRANRLNVAVRGRGDNAILMDAVQFEGDIGSGSLAVMVEISASDWYDLETRQAATDEVVSAVSIPDNLRANYREVRFQFDAGRHSIFFVSKFGRVAFAASAMKSYLSKLFDHYKIRSIYGPVNVTIVQDTVEIANLLEIDGIKELQVIVDRPNPHSIIGDDAEVQAALEEMRSGRMTISIEADESGSVRPTKEIKNLANVAARSGEVKAIVKEEGDSVARSVSSVKFPAREDVQLEKGETVDHALARGREALTRKHLDTKG